MKISLYITLIFLSLFVASCETLSLPMVVSGFKFKLEDAGSRAHISGANVDQHTIHQTGRKRFESESRSIGNTNSQGIVHVEKLNMKARAHTFSFQKSGYETMDVVVQYISGQYIGMPMIRSTEKMSGKKVAITEGALVTIPMPRK